MTQHTLTADRHTPRDPDWYRCNYLLAVGYAAVAQTAKTRSLPDKLANPELQAKKYALQAATAIEETLHLTQGKPSARALNEFLIALEPTVLLLLAGVTRRWGTSEPIQHTADPHTADRGRDSHGRTSDAERRERFFHALETEPLTDEQIIDYVQTLQLDYRAHYNLACYYAGRGDDAHKKSDERNRYYELALSEASAALKTAPPDLVDWASHDPSLAGLREDTDEFGPRFHGLIESLSPDAPAGRAVRRAGNARR